MEVVNIWQGNILKTAVIHALLKLDPRLQFHNPVMFTVYISAIFITAMLLLNSYLEEFVFMLIVAINLWFTVLFANFAESLAEGRGKAQAKVLRAARKTMQARKISEAKLTAKETMISSADLRKNDLVLVKTGEFIPSDGEVIEGIAAVNESAITGESAPVIRESGGDRSSVTGGTQVISDWLMIKITANHGETFLERMVSLIEGAQRQKTPNELALTLILSALTLIFLWVSVTILPFARYSLMIKHQIINDAGLMSGGVLTITVLAALFVCLAPTTIGGLLSAIGIAGIDRMTQANVIALSGNAVEAAGNVDVLLLDKTGTVTLGNRQATELIPAEGINIKELAIAAQLASLADETPEGRSISILVKNKYGLRGQNLAALEAKFVPFSAQSRMSGVDLKNLKIRKGASQAIEKYLQQISGKGLADRLKIIIADIARQGSTPLVVISNSKVLGIICLKDIIKGGIAQRFSQMRKMGIKTIMITGDNAQTAAAIAAEAGVDDFLAEVNPEAKLALIKNFQAQGHLVAMTGDGTNDAPALAQADVAVAMNTGTQTAKEAGNLIDLDSNPTKLIEIIAIGKQLLITRGALTTFSIANDVAKYFAVLPAVFMPIHPELKILNIMHLSTPKTAIIAAVIFNTFSILALIPLAIKGVKYRHKTAKQLLLTNVLWYGGGGLVLPFIGIKLIDWLLNIV